MNHNILPHTQCIARHLQLSVTLSQSNVTTSKPYKSELFLTCSHVDKYKMSQLVEVLPLPVCAVIPFSALSLRLCMLIL